MTVRYLFVDAHAQLRLIHREHVEAIWHGRARAADFGCGNLTELRLISVVCGRRLMPKRVFLLRLALTDGYFTRQDYRTLRSFTQPNHVTALEAFHHHSDGWPRDFFTQLAVALDVPRSNLDVPFGIGGPLLIAAALKISPKSAARYLR